MPFSVVKQKQKRTTKKQILIEQPYKQGVKVNIKIGQGIGLFAHDFLFNTVDKNIFKLSRNKIKDKNR